MDRALLQLKEEYKKLYKFSDLYYYTRPEEDGIVTLAIGMSGERGKIEARIKANEYQTEDDHVIAALIARLHREFMTLVFRKVREQIW